MPEMQRIRSESPVAPTVKLEAKPQRQVARLPLRRKAGPKHEGHTYSLVGIVFALS